MKPGERAPAASADLDPHLIVDRLLAKALKRSREAYRPSFLRLLLPLLSEKIRERLTTSGRLFLLPDSLFERVVDREELVEMGHSEQLLDLVRRLDQDELSFQLLEASQVAD